MRRMKKVFAVAFLAMFVSSNAFALRNIYVLKKNDEVIAVWCSRSGGTCFDDVIIE